MFVEYQGTTSFLEHQTQIPDTHQPPDAPETFLDPLEHSIEIMEHC